MKRFHFTILLFVFQYAHILQAQCPLQNQVEYLHVNNIRAGILNRGDAFWDLQDAKFQVPYQGIETPSTIFTSNLWFGGKDSGANLKIAANTYRQNCGYIPGPVNQEIYSNSLEAAHNWNKVFKVSGAEILAHKADFEDNGQIDDPIAAVFGWPAYGNSYFELYHGFEIIDNGSFGYADFYDLNENDIYEPDKGEYPTIIYDEQIESQSIPGAIFWSVYHTWDTIDSTNQNGTKLHLEIQQTSWAMACEDELLSNTIFTKYKIKNFHTYPIHDFKFGLWMDPDLGCHLDDYVGCSPELNTLYLYNKDNYDDLDCANINGYGENPPVQTVTFLGDSGLDGFMYFHNSGIGEFPTAITSPSTETEFYNVLSGKWKDGSALTKGGSGYNPGSSDTTLYAFPDNPNYQDGWSMVAVDKPAGDYRFVGISDYSSGSGFQPGAILECEFAYSFFRDEGLDHLEQVSNALAQIPLLQDKYAQGFPACTIESCDCHCVWPGDTDSNGTVNYKDAINIFKNFSNTGPERLSPVAWIGREAEDWDNNAPGSINAKYADASGDGIIDSIDTEIVSGLLGEKNMCFDSLFVDCPEGTDLIWDIKFGIDSVFGSFPKLFSDLILSDANEFWGISYQLSYDPDLFKVLIAENEIEWENTTIESLRFENNEESTGLFQFIEFNDMKMNKGLKETGDNKVLELVMDPLDVPESYPTSFTEVTICDAKLYYEDGTEKILPAQRMRFKMPDEVIISETEKISIKRNTVYPNPASGKLNFNWNLQELTMIEVIDQNGQFVKSIQPFPEMNSIDISDLPPGMYVLRAIKESGVDNLKFLVF